MAAQVYYETFAVTASSNGIETELALSHLDSAKRVIDRIYADSVANVNVLVYADQLEVMNVDSQHFPSNGSGFDLPIDLSNIGQVTVGINNQTGSAHTHNITIRYTQG